MPRLIDYLRERAPLPGRGMERIIKDVQPEDFTGAVVMVCDDVPAGDAGLERIKDALGFADREHGPITNINPATYPFLAPIAPIMFLEMHQHNALGGLGPTSWGALVTSVTVDQLLPDARARVYNILRGKGHYLTRNQAVPADAWVQSWALVIQHHKTGKPPALMAAVILLVGADGTWLDLVSVTAADFIQNAGVDAEQQTSGQAAGYAMWFLDPLMYGLSLAHCKNVKLVTETRSRADRRRAEREGRDLVQYRRIVIDGTLVRRVGGKAAPSSEPRTKALHIVRGHFATYTAEAPLFGRHVGRFYHPAHTRGSVDAGVVSKDYVARP